MKFVSWIIAAALAASVIPAHAQNRIGRGLPSGGGQAQGGPLALLYVVSGVRDNGGAANVGTATTFHCTNASTAAENIQIQVRDFAGGVVSDHTYPLNSGRTWTTSTHDTAVFDEDADLSPGGTIIQGLAFIFATTQFMFCSAMLVEAASPTPSGISLHMVRFSPVAGTSE